MLRTIVKQLVNFTVPKIPEGIGKRLEKKTFLELGKTENHFENKSQSHSTE